MSDALSTFVIATLYFVAGVMAGVSFTIAISYAMGYRRPQREPDIRASVERTLRQWESARIQAVRTRPQRVSPHPDTDHLLTAIEQANSALDALQIGHYGTVRMLLIRIRGHINSEVTQRSSEVSST